MVLHRPIECAAVTGHVAFATNPPVSHAEYRYIFWERLCQVRMHAKYEQRGPVPRGNPVPSDGAELISWIASLEAGRDVSESYFDSLRFRAATHTGSDIRLRSFCWSVFPWTALPLSWTIKVRR